MKTYVITLSRYFLANHKRAGEETHFKEKFILGQGLTDYDTPSMAKIHTIRANYPLWEKRIKEAQEGRAVLFGDMKRSSPIFDFEVIGNIHDNPELMKQAYGETNS